LHSWVIQQYKQIYENMDFERAGLFEALAEHYLIQQVLYPGSNIHITPSFYFPHVVYVDLAENALKFFQQEKEIMAFINANKKYKRPAYIRFIHEDFTKPLPLREGEFDLLLSLFAGGISTACHKYLKKGGILLSNNHQQDALQALQTNCFTLEAILTKKQKKYEFQCENLETYLKNIEKRTKQNLCRNHPRGGIQYRENETFYIFKKK